MKVAKEDVPCGAALESAKGTRAYFDGGCRKHEGYCGATVFSSARVLMWADAIFLGVNTDTHNKAEARRMVFAHQLDLGLLWEVGCAGLTVLGCSDLVISFM